VSSQTPKNAKERATYIKQLHDAVIIDDPTDLSDFESTEGTNSVGDISENNQTEKINQKNYKKPTIFQKHQSEIFNGIVVTCIVAVFIFLFGIYASLNKDIGSLSATQNALSKGFESITEKFDSLFEKTVNLELNQRIILYRLDSDNNPQNDR